MPGRDITRLPNRAFRAVAVLGLILFAGAQLLLPAQSPSAAPPNQTNTPAATPNQESNSQAPSGDKKSSDDQGVFVFKHDVDEVLLHATVQDDKNHLVTNLDRGAFTVYEDGKPQTIIHFHNEDIPVAM